MKVKDLVGSVPISEVNSIEVKRLAVGKTVIVIVWGVLSCWRVSPPQALCWQQEGKPSRPLDPSSAIQPFANIEESTGTRFRGLRGHAVASHSRPTAAGSGT